MNIITVTGVRPYDGSYELDLDAQPLTTREWGWIKRNAGYLPLTLTSEAFSDPELIMVLAVIAIRRSGSVQTGQVTEVLDRFNDAPFGSALTIEATPDEEEDDAAPGPKQQREAELQWGQFTDRFGELGDAPESYWQPAVGYFGVRAVDIGELTPMMLLECALLFEQIVGVGA